MRVSVLVALMALSCCATVSDGVARVALRRGTLNAADTFRLPWHKHWAPPAPSYLRKLGGETGSVPRQTVVGNVTDLREYYVELRVGGQVINVLLDTGSSTLAVPLKECITCSSYDRSFDAARAVGEARFISCDSAECGKDTCHLPGQCASETCSKGGECCSYVKPSKCGFLLWYAGGSIAAGALVEAVVGIAGMEVPLTFGGILLNSPRFQNFPMDGILGLAYPSLACNPTCVTPLFDALVKEGKVAQDVFGLCTSKKGGQLLLGGSDPYFYNGALQYTPIRPKPKDDFYDVDIRGARVGSRSVELPHFSVGIVDSGTTLLVVAPSAYQALRDHFQTYYCNVPGLCPSPGVSRAWAPGRGGIVRVAEDHAFGLDADVGVERGVNVSHGMGAGSYPSRAADDGDTDWSWFNPGYCEVLSLSQVRLLPDITIELEGGVKLTVGPDDYMENLTKDILEQLKDWFPNLGLAKGTEFWCLGIMPMEGLETMRNNVIIGDTWLQKFYVEYDRENHRLGFAPSKNCVLPEQERSQLVKEEDIPQGAKKPNEDAQEDAQELRGSSAGVFRIVSAVGCALILCLGAKKPNEDAQEDAQELRGSSAGVFRIVSAVGCALILCLGAKAYFKRDYTPIL